MRTPPLIRWAIGSLFSGRSGAKEKYLAAVTATGQSLTSCAVRNSHGVASLACSRLCIGLPRGIRGPASRFGSFGSGLKLRDQHRRGRREVVRVDDLEQRLGEARELRLHLELNAGREEGDPFEQPLDVRIRHLEAGHPQPGGDLRELLGELGTHLAQVLQFSVVVPEQARVHYFTREETRSAISTLPVSRSISVRTSSSSGIGCAHSCPRISMPTTL